MDYIQSGSNIEHCGTLCWTAGAIEWLCATQTDFFLNFDTLICVKSRRIRFCIDKATGALFSHGLLSDSEHFEPILNYFGTTQVRAAFPLTSLIISSTIFSSTKLNLDSKFSYACFEYNVDSQPLTEHIQEFWGKIKGRAYISLGVSGF